jgi:hypothetical protein
MRQDLLAQLNEPDHELWILSSDGTVLLGKGAGKKPFPADQVGCSLVWRQALLERRQAGTEPVLKITAYLHRP